VPDESDKSDEGDMIPRDDEFPRRLLIHRDARRIERKREREREKERGREESTANPLARSLGFARSAKRRAGVRCQNTAAAFGFVLALISRPVITITSDRPRRARRISVVKTDVCARK